MTNQTSDERRERYKAAIVGALPLSSRAADAAVAVADEEIGEALCVGHDSRQDEVDRLRASARKRAEDNILLRGENERLRAELDDLRAVDADRLKLSEENVQLSEENARLRARVAELEQQAVADTHPRSPAEPCGCSNGYECPHRCWHCGGSREAGCESWCHIRPFDAEEAQR